MVQTLVVKGTHASRLRAPLSGEEKTMKKMIVVACALLATAAFAESHFRSGYVTKNGTYVAPSYATNPNSTRVDNYSSQGNVNPYSGRVGTVDPYRQPSYQPSQPRCGANQYGQYVCQ